MNWRRKFILKLLVHLPFRRDYIFAESQNFEIKISLANAFLIPPNLINPSLCDHFSYVFKSNATFTVYFYHLFLSACIT